jgi:hypothetical protein
MARNQNCNCLCHGSDGNYTADVYFSCKNCYAANHMEALPRRQASNPKPTTRKPKATGASATSKAVDLIIKASAAMLMEDLATAAESLKKS